MLADLGIITPPLDSLDQMAKKLYSTWIRTLWVAFIRMTKRSNWRSPETEDYERKYSIASHDNSLSLTSWNASQDVSTLVKRLEDHINCLVRGGLQEYQVVAGDRSKLERFLEAISCTKKTMNARLANQTANSVNYTDIPVCTVCGTVVEERCYVSRRPFPRWWHTTCLPCRYDHGPRPFDPPLDSISCRFCSSPAPPGVSLEHSLQLAMTRAGVALRDFVLVQRQITSAGAA